MKKKNKKIEHKTKKIIMTIIFGISFIFLIISFIINLIPNNKFKSIGYNEIEIKEIKKLTEEEQNIISKYDYNKNLIFIITSKNYNKDKLNLYINYTLKYSNINYLKIFELLNNTEFKEDEIENYIKLLNKYNNIDGIIKYINNYKDKNIDINEATLALISEKYFIIDFLDRYIKYYNNNKSLEYAEIIKRVNSNLDYKFYDDSNVADTSLEMLTLVNKYYYLDKYYVPKDLITISGEYARDTTQLVKIAYDNFINMATNAKQEGLTLKITTGYRSYNFQSTLYNNYVKIDGIKEADKYSARPGYSEHQLGYSVDITNKELVSFNEFQNTNEFKWLSNNAHKYGFILRYPQNKEYITGYIFEAWHYRYVGVDIATYIYENNLTYEEYYAYFLR